MSSGRITINAILLGNRHETGVERCIRGLIEALAEYGRLTYTVWTRAGAGIKLPEGPRFRMHSVNFPFHSRGLRILWEQTVFAMQLRRNPPDVLHAPGYIAPAAASGPLVLTVYDLVALRFPQWASRANAWHYRCLMPLSVRRAAAVVTPSLTVRNEVMERFGLPPSSVTVIPPPVAPFFHKKPTAQEVDAVTRHYSLPAGYLLYAGNIEPKKNPEGLLEAYAVLCRQQPLTPPLVIAGRMAWKSRAFNKRCRTPELRDRVLCLGAVTDRDLRAIYRSARLLVMPSWYEGYGLPPLEAMACGTPVVVCAGGALPETVGDAAVIVPPGDIPALAGAMRNLLDNDAQGTMLVEKGFLQAQRRTMRDLAADHDNLYSRIIGDLM